MHEPYNDQQSAEPPSKRRAPSGTVPRQSTAENTSQPDSLTNKLTEKSSAIINSVLSGKGTANAAAEQLSTEHTVNASLAGQPKRPAPAPLSKPKNTCVGSGKSDGRRQKETESVPATVQSARGKAPPWLSPNSRPGPDTQASLVRMATAPRSRREQLELERMLHEHTKKLAAAKDHMPERLSSADGAGVSSSTNSSQPTSQLNVASGGSNSFQFPYNRSEVTKSTPSDDVIVVGEDAGSSNIRGVQTSLPSSSNAVQSGSTRRADIKSVRKPRNKNKTKTAKVPKAKFPMAKGARSRMTKTQAKTAKSKASRQQTKQRRVVSNSMQTPRNPLPVPGSAYTGAVRPLLSQILTDGLTGSLGLSQGLVGSQNVSPSASQATERGTLNTLLQMSLHEEDLCSRLSQYSSEIEQLQNAMAKLDEELQKRIRMHANVSSVCSSASYDFLL